MESSQNSEFVAIEHLKNIKEAISQKDLESLGEKITVLTKHIFNFTDLLYSNVSEHFEHSGIMNLLFDCLWTVNQQCKRDILRFLNIFLKTSVNLRNVATSNNKFVEFLLKQLETKDSWNNIETKKYYINIASFLLINKSVKIKFKTDTIRRVTRDVLTELKKDDNYRKKLPCLVFYASAEINANVGYPDSNSDNDHDKLLCKDTINMFIETIRDYTHDFKMFYNNQNCDKCKYYKYSLKAEYSFDQICQTIVYYAQTNAKLRDNLYQSGIYELSSLIFLIKNTPDLFISNVIELFSIVTLDKNARERFCTENKPCVDKLRVIRNHESITIKNAVDSVLVKLENQSNVINKSFQISLSNQSSQTETEQFSINSEFHSHGTINWESTEIELWLSEIKLTSLKSKLSSLTGKGLNQMVALMKEKNGRFMLIELLISKLDLDLISVLEFMGALETLNEK